MISPGSMRSLKGGTEMEIISVIISFLCLESSDCSLGMKERIIHSGVIVFG